MKKVDRFVDFGKFKLNLYDLRSKNEVYVVYFSKAVHPRLGRTKVSDKFKQIILDILEHVKIDYKSLALLDKSEFEYFNKLMTMTSLKFQLNYEPSNQLKELKERLTILQGSIQAGNDNNPFVYEEAIEVVNALVKHNAISESDGTEIIDELKESQNN